MKKAIKKIPYPLAIVIIASIISVFWIITASANTTQITFTTTNVNGILSQAEVDAQIASAGILKTNDFDASFDSTVYEIDNQAFQACTGLKNVTISNQITTINQYAFSGCNTMTNITFDTGSMLQVINLSAFMNCDALTSVSLPEGLKTIGNGCFRYCDLLSQINIPSSTTSIGSLAFTSCPKLTTVSIGTNSVLATIGTDAFMSTGLKSIDIPASVNTIEDKAFRDCNSLTAVNVDANNANYTSLDGVLFNKNKTTLILYPSGNINTSYTLPYGVTTIKLLAFDYAKYLTSVKIQSTPTIENEAFYYCKNLTDIYFYSKTKLTVGTSPFSQMGPVLRGHIYPNAAYNATTNPNGFPSPWCGLTMQADITDIIFRDLNSDGILSQSEVNSQIASTGITSSFTAGFDIMLSQLGDNAFSNNSKITLATISKNITTVSENSFLNNPNLTSFSVDVNNTNFSSLSGVLFNKDKTQIIAYPLGKSLLGYVVPNSVTSINNYSFFGFNGILVMPENVSSIGYEALNPNNNLFKVVVCKNSFAHNFYKDDINFKDNMRLLGDVNLDGDVTNGDALFVKNHYSYGTRLITPFSDLADVNFDGIISSADYNLFNSLIN